MTTFRRVLIVVVPFVAIVVFVGLQALHARHRERQKRTIGDLRTAATAVESYSIDNQHYPVVPSIDELRPFVEPTYVKVLPLRDGWGRPFAYVSDGQEYTIASRGPDGDWEPTRPDGENVNTLPTTSELLSDLLRVR